MPSPRARPDRMNAELDHLVARRLRSRGQRFTTGRRVLVEVLRSAGQPLAIHEILARRKGLAQSSVYRNLVVLEQAEVVRRLSTGGEFARFELAEDLTSHHHHLVCISCGLVEDLPSSSGLEQTVQRVTAGLASRRGFRVRSHRVDMLGYCSNCQ
jgi:Fur family transcriptional regulator, ferric uptake regulator